MIGIEFKSKSKKDKINIHRRIVSESVYKRTYEPKLLRKEIFDMVFCDIWPTPFSPSCEHPVIAWWSGGVTSAIVCLMCIEQYGKENVRIVHIETKNEHEDTYRFKFDCEKLYGKKIETLFTELFDSIEDVWYERLSINVAGGAICSSELKRDVRRKFVVRNTFSHHAFGFDTAEERRVDGMLKNNNHLYPIFPLIEQGLSKQDCIKILEEKNIEIPEPYKLGYNNNNCFKTMCVQGGKGYWQKVKKDFPEKFSKMSKVERDLSWVKGKPVTVLRDKELKPVFLEHNPEFPDIKDLSMFKEMKVKSVLECNGFCGKHEVNFN